MRIVKQGEEIHVYCRYHPLAPREFRELCGKWEQGKWVFPSNWEPEVKKACKKIYGHDGDKAPPRHVDVLIKGNINPAIYLDPKMAVWFLGRNIFSLIEDKSKAKNHTLKLDPCFKVYGYKKTPEKSDVEVFKDLFNCEGFGISNVPLSLVEDLIANSEHDNLGLEIKIIDN